MRHFVARARNTGKPPNTVPELLSSRMVPDMWEVTIREEGSDEVAMVSTLGYTRAEEAAERFIAKVYDLRPSEFTMDFRPDIDDELYEETVAVHREVERLHKAYREATARRQKLVRQIADQGYSASVIADMWGISRARVQQIYTAAVKGQAPE